MTDSEMLAVYREGVLAVRDLEDQLSLRGTEGSLRDGLEALLARRRAELAALAPQIARITGCIDSARVYTVILQFYVQGMTIEEIAERIFITPRAVSRIKRQFLLALSDRQDAPGQPDVMQASG